MPSQSELTGNANGELGFLPLEQPASWFKSTKTTVVSESLSITCFSLQDLDTFAFAYWGGDFYLFVRTLGMGQSTNVYRVERDGTQTLILEDSGLNIVGAGVSTWQENRPTKSLNSHQVYRWHSRHFNRHQHHSLGVFYSGCQFLGV